MLMTPEKYAELSGLKRSAVVRYLKMGKIKGHKVSPRKWLCEVDDSQVINQNQNTATIPEQNKV
jgi:predicted site-specific integrase-resolvase